MKIQGFWAPEKGQKYKSFGPVAVVKKGGTQRTQGPQLLLGSGGEAVDGGKCVEALALCVPCVSACDGLYVEIASLREEGVRECVWACKHPPFLG